MIGPAGTFEAELAAAVGPEHVERVDHAGGPGQWRVRPGSDVWLTGAGCGHTATRGSA